MSDTFEHGERIVLKRSAQTVRSEAVIGVIVLVPLLIFLQLAHAPWFFTCFSLAGLLFALVGSFFVLKDDKPKIIMDENGIWARDKGRFAWETIQEIWPEYYRGVCLLVLKFKDQKQVRFPISNLTMQPDDIRYYITKQLTSVRAKTTPNIPE